MTITGSIYLSMKNQDIKKYIPERFLKIGCVLVFAIAIRVGYVAVVPPRPVGWDDAGSWDSVAWNVRQGRGFLEYKNLPTSQRPPVYPLFLAAVYFVFGHNLIAAKIFQCLADVVTIFIVYRLAQKIFPPPLPLISAAALALYPPLIVYNGIIGAEILFTMMLALAMYFLVLAQGGEEESDSGNLFLWMASGLFFGLSALTRSTSVFFPFFYASAMIFSEGKLRFRRRTAAFILIFILTLLPWSLRNYYTLGSFTPIASGGGGLFWAATVPDFNGEPAPYPMENYYDEAKGRQFHEQDSFAFRLAIKNIISRPVFYLKMAGMRFYRVLTEPVGKTLVSRKSFLAGRVLAAVHNLMIILSVIGAVSSLGSHSVKRLLPLLMIIFYFIVVNSLIASVPRYRLPVEPYILCFAVQGAGWLFLQIVRKKNSVVSR